MRGTRYKKQKLNILNWLVYIAAALVCAAACVLWIWKKRRIAISDKCDIVTYYVLLTVGAAVVCLVYLMPLVLCAV